MHQERRKKNCGLKARLKNLNKRKKNQVSDKRNVKLNEAISGMRTVKLYAWEHVIERNVEKIRSQEEEHLKGIAWYDAILSFITMSIPQLCIAATLMLYVHVRSVFECR